MHEEIRQEESGLRRHVQDRVPAFLSTLVGGVVAMGVNAPLTSPHDLIANARSVAVVSLIAAIIAGMIWGRIKGDIQTRSRTFNIVLTVLLLLTVGSAAAIEYGGEISHAIRYIIPLGAIVTIFVSVLTPIIERWKTQTALLVIAAALPFAMLAAGYILTINEFGFTEPLSIPFPTPPPA